MRTKSARKKFVVRDCCFLRKSEWRFSFLFSNIEWKIIFYLLHHLGKTFSYSVVSRSRDAAFNEGRALLDAFINSDEESFDSMEVDKKYSGTLHRYKQYANKLMMSEWMLEVPEDYLEKWLIVPCPEGRRTLLVACKVCRSFDLNSQESVVSLENESIEILFFFIGKNESLQPTRSEAGQIQFRLTGWKFQRAQQQLHNFGLYLAEGWKEISRPWRISVVESAAFKLWRKISFPLYLFFRNFEASIIIDVCWIFQAEFRLYWLKSKFEDTQNLQTGNTSRNTYPILPLPYASCNEATCEIVDKSLALEPLDGFLFFHREGQYTNGRSPLVLWLKPFMINEVLGIAIPPSLDDRPDGYIDFQHYIESRKSRSKDEKGTREVRKKKKKKGKHVFTWKIYIFWFNFGRLVWWSNFIKIDISDLLLESDVTVKNQFLFGMACFYFFNYSNSRKSVTFSKNHDFLEYS